MYKDIIYYRLNENSSQEHLLKVAKKVYQDWMKNQDGFIKWEIHHQKEDKYIDFVHWESKKHAKAAEAKMLEMPHAGEWFACYHPGSITSDNVEDVAIFGE